MERLKTWWDAQTRDRQVIMGGLGILLVGLLGWFLLRPATPAPLPPATPPVNRAAQSSVTHSAGTTASQSSATEGPYNGRACTGLSRECGLRMPFGKRGAWLNVPTGRRLISRPDWWTNSNFTCRKKARKPPQRTGQHQDRREAVLRHLPRQPGRTRPLI